MIVESMSSGDYRRLFAKKFRNFGDKSPILLSYTLDEFGVQVVHVNSNTVYDYDWDYAVPVESLIHRIKQDILVHYPRISKAEEIRIPYTPEQQAEMMAAGVPADELPSYKAETKVHVYRIDKVMALRDEVILVDEETGRSGCWKLGCSAVFFLKKYREGKFESMEAAGDEFFRKASFIKDTTRRA